MGQSHDTEGSRVRVLKRFPHEVRVLKDVWIPLSDGIRLSATIWHNATHDPLSAQAHTDWEIGIGRQEWQTRLEVDGRMWASPERFLVANSVMACESGHPFSSGHGTMMSLGAC